METSERFRIGAIACALLAGVSVAASGKIIHVDDDATGANDGSSWANAFPWLQEALIVAVAGDEIRVAQGTYKPPDRSPDWAAVTKRTNRPMEMTFSIGNGVVLRGSYAGTGAPDPNTRDVEVYRTILSGDLNNDDSNVQDSRALGNAAGRADNSLRVVTVEQAASCVLDGFLIQGGVDSGLLIQGSNPTVWNCTFSHNLGRYGGAVSITGGSGRLSRAGFHNCRFETNAVLKGGGALYIWGGELLLTGCEFVGNTATSWGGGVYGDAADVTLSGCVFRSNWAGEGGGLFHFGGGLHLMDCAFLENASLPAEMSPYNSTSSGAGGAVLVNIPATGQGAVVTDCLFRHNQALQGGAIEGTLKAVRGCRFTGNVASYGGAIDNRGPLICENCLFDGNRATAHAAALRNYDQLQLTNCTFIGNRSPDGYVFHAYGGHGAPVDITLNSCIVWGKPHGLDLRERWLNKATVGYSDIEGGYPGTGNIDADPCLADPGRWDPNGTPDDLSDDFWVEGDYHLKSRAGRWDAAAAVWVQDEVSSPCIDAGGPGEAVSEEPLPNGGRVNMGAYGGTAEASKSYLNKP